MLNKEPRPEVILTIPARMANDPRFLKIVAGVIHRYGDDNVRREYTLEKDPTLYFPDTSRIFWGFHTLWSLSRP